jgi:translation initiation factor IF-2
LKHVKTDIETAIKGSDCGLSFEGFETFQEGDTVLAYEEYEVKRRL